MYLIVGASGSGKSTVARKLCEVCGMKEVISYTTRPKRYDGEEGHIFVERYDGNGVCYSEFNCYEYWCTKEQLNECDVYVVDWNGIDMLKENDSLKEDDVIVYLNVDEDVRARRMRIRGDSEEMVKERIENDRKMFPEDRMYDADIIFNNMSVEEIINELQSEAN